MVRGVNAASLLTLAWQSISGHALVTARSGGKSRQVEHLEVVRSKGGGVMKRRGFMRGLTASMVMLVVPLTAQAQTPEAQVEGSWRYDKVSDPNIGLHSFQLSMTEYATDDEAAGAFSRILDELDAGAIYDESTHNESYGDESFFAEFQNLGGLILVYEGFVRFGSLILDARWEADHFGGARDGYRLFEGIIERAEEGGEGEALFPSDDELASYGLT